DSCLKLTGQIKYAIQKIRLLFEITGSQEDLLRSFPFVILGNSQNRDLTVSDYTCCLAANQQLFDSAGSRGSHNDQVRSEFCCFGNNGFLNLSRNQVSHCYDMLRQSKCHLKLLQLFAGLSDKRLVKFFI